MSDTTGTPGTSGATPHPETDGMELLQRLHDERYITLALADQISEDRWHEPLLPGSRAIHDLLAHLIAWDEWAIGVFEISVDRPLPPSLTRIPNDVDAFNERSVHRFHTISRLDMLNGLQSSSDRLVKSALAAGGDAWHRRELPDLARDPNAARKPTVSTVLRSLTRHEASHHQEIMDTYGVSAPPPTQDGEHETPGR